MWGSDRWNRAWLGRSLMWTCVLRLAMTPLISVSLRLALPLCLDMKGLKTRLVTVLGTLGLPLLTLIRKGRGLLALVCMALLQVAWTWTRGLGGGVCFSVLVVPCSRPRISRITVLVLISVGGSEGLQLSITCGVWFASLKTWCVWLSMLRTPIVFCCGGEALLNCLIRLTSVMT